MRPAITICAIVAATIVAPATALAGGFGQLNLPGGCITQYVSSDDGTQSCATGQALDGAAAVAVSPDGQNVYVASNYTAGFGWGGIAVFSRDATTGTLKQIGCLSSDSSDGDVGTEGSCTLVSGIRGADAIAVSPDGSAVYVGTARAGGVASFTRAPATGLLTPTGCLVEIRDVGSTCGVAHVFAQVSAVSLTSQWLFAGSSQRGAISTLAAGPFGYPATSAAANTLLDNPCIATAGPDTGCTNANALQSVEALALSADGKTLFAATGDTGAIDWFTIDPTTGALTQSGCLLGGAPPGPCADSQLLSQPTSLAVSPDGLNVYVADSSSNLVVLKRDPTSGALTDGECYDELAAPGSDSGSSDDQSDPCQQVPGLDNVNSVAVSPDGSTVYVGGDGNFAVFSRNAAQGGTLTETSCAVSGDDRCGSLTGANGVPALAVSPDGQNVYYAAPGQSSLLSFGPGTAIATGRATVAPNGTVRLTLVCARRVRRSCAGNVILGNPTRKPSHTAGVGGPARFTIRRGGVLTITLRVPASMRASLDRHGELTLPVLVEPARGGGGGDRRRVLLVRG